LVVIEISYLLKWQSRESDRSMNDEAVLTFLADRLVFPSL